MKLKAMIFILLVSVAQGVCAEVIEQGMDILTPDERAAGWLGASASRGGETLVIAMYKDFLPFTFLNAEGQPAGIFVDIWRLWAEKTDRKIEFRLTSWKGTMDNLRNGDADIHSGLLRYEARESWVDYSQAIYEMRVSTFFPVKCGKISGLNELSGQKVGTIRGSYHETYLHRHYPNINIILFNSTEDMVRAARDGKICAAVATCPSTSAHISRLGLSGE